MGSSRPCNDIGILGSTDILAIDNASVDLVYALPETQRHDLVERIESRGGLHQLEQRKAFITKTDGWPNPTRHHPIPLTR